MSVHLSNVPPAAVDVHKAIEIETAAYSHELLEGIEKLSAELLSRLGKSSEAALIGFGKLKEALDKTDQLAEEQFQELEGLFVDLKAQLTNTAPLDRIEEELMKLNDVLTILETNLSHS